MSICFRGRSPATRQTHCQPECNRGSDGPCPGPRQMRLSVDRAEGKPLVWDQLYPPRPSREGSSGHGE